MRHFVESCKILTAITPTAGAAGTTDIEATECDMQGFDAVAMVVRFGTITSGAVTSIKAQQDTATGMASAADLEGTSQTVADTDDGDTFVIDIIKPEERFVRLYVDRATQNAVVAEAHYVLYNAKTEVVTQGSTVNSETFVTPDEGTA